MRTTTSKRAAHCLVRFVPSGQFDSSLAFSATSAERETAATGRSDSSEAEESWLVAQPSAESWFARLRFVSRSKGQRGQPLPVLHQAAVLPQPGSPEAWVCEVQGVPDGYTVAPSPSKRKKSSLLSL